MTERTGPVARAPDGENSTGLQASMQESIVDHIKKDHQKTTELMMELEKRVQGRPTSELPVFPTMKKELLGHMMAGEKLLSPFLEQEMTQLIQNARREQNEVRQHLDHLTAGNMPEDEWARHLQMMKQGIQHDVREEESRSLPAAQRMLGAEIKRMGEQQI